MSKSVNASVAVSAQQKNQIDCFGAWTLQGIHKQNLDRTFKKWDRRTESSLILNAESITRMDSSGAWQLYQWKKQLAKKREVQLIGLNKEHTLLFGMIEQGYRPEQSIFILDGHKLFTGTLTASHIGNAGGEAESLTRRK